MHAPTIDAKFQRRHKNITSGGTRDSLTTHTRSIRFHLAPLVQHTQLKVKTQRGNPYLHLESTKCRTLPPQGSAAASTLVSHCASLPRCTARWGQAPPTSPPALWLLFLLGSDPGALLPACPSLHTWVRWVRCVFRRDLALHEYPGTQARPTQRAVGSGLQRTSGLRSAGHRRGLWKRRIV